MTLALDPGYVQRFRDIVGRTIGLAFDDSKQGFLAEVLCRRAGARGDPPESYLASLENGGLAGEAGLLAEELTVGETYFFRNGDQFRAFAELVLPERRQLRSASRQLRFLSAGCSSGDEAYTLAIILREAIPDPAWTISIRAVDINPAALRKAAAARFSGWALRDTPEPIQARWFRRQGRDMILLDEARNAVQFEQRNITIDDGELWQPQAYDAIFCRNVIMYLAPAVGRKVVARIARALAPGGYLFLGHAETLRGLSQEFDLVHTHDTFYYRRKGGAHAAPPRFPEFAVAAPYQPPGPAAEGTWYEAIARASERIEALTRVSAPGVAAISPEPLPWDLGTTLDLLQRERFGEALEQMHGLPAEAADDADVLLLRAVLLVHSGQVALAGEACRRILADDVMNAGANYVLALCLEAAGDRVAASDHYRVACHLDPTFAMPQLHLGLIARRAGDYATASKALGQALALIEREEAPRIILFGGGFTREALIAICAAELRVCEGRT